MFYTSKQVAKKLNISVRRVLALAKSRGIGLKVSRIWVYDDKDIANMKYRKTGHPAPEDIMQ